MSKDKETQLLQDEVASNPNPQVLPCLILPLSIFFLTRELVTLSLKVATLRSIFKQYGTKAEQEKAFLRAHQARLNAEKILLREVCLPFCVHSGHHRQG